MQHLDKTVIKVLHWISSIIHNTAIKVTAPTHFPTIYDSSLMGKQLPIHGMMTMSSTPHKVDSSCYFFTFQQPACLHF